MAAESYHPGTWAGRSLRLRLQGAALAGLDLGDSALPAQQAPAPAWLPRLLAALAAGARAESLRWVEPYLIPGWGTGFQKAVLGTLRDRVPAGSTCTYAELAALCGRPRGARAVARALATNPLPIIFPCHRVLPKQGGLGGFAGREEDGQGWKAALLKAEAR